MAVKEYFVKIDPNTYYIISLTFSILTFILSTVIAIWHINKVCDKLRKSDFKSKPSLIVSIPFCIYCVICVIIWGTAVIDPFQSIQFCHFQKIIAVNMYPLFKVLQSVMLTLRLHEVYNSSALGYNWKTLSIWAAFLSLWGAFTVIVQPITSTVELDTKCDIFVHNIFVLSVLGFDVFAGIGNCYLFIKPIYKLRKLNLRDNAKLKQIARKQMVLCIVAIASSVIAVIAIGIIDFPQVFAGTDIVISTICIILMYKWNNSLYERMCFCCVVKDIEQRTLQQMSPSSIEPKESTVTPAIASPV